MTDIRFASTGKAPGTTIVVPELDSRALPELERMVRLTCVSEIDAIEKLRQFYAEVATQGGQIKLLSLSDHGEVLERYHQSGSERTKAFVAVDQYHEKRIGAEEGIFSGRRLHLVAGGIWLETERTGKWTGGVNLADKGKKPNRPRPFRCWFCDMSALPAELASLSWPSPVGCNELTDAEVATRYSLVDILRGLSTSIDKLAAKLRTEYAAQVQRKTIADQVIDHFTMERQDS